MCERECNGINNIFILFLLYMKRHKVINHFLSKISADFPEVFLPA
ncbi:MAG: hypothetical protein RHS_4605 [Robinsoniella sp. RHS]|nr:MAG: hypothetical protein RHS_4605 [Robinsoniella sp. RHS]